MEIFPGRSRSLPSPRTVTLQCLSLFNLSVTCFNGTNGADFSRPDSGIGPPLPARLPQVELSNMEQKQLWQIKLCLVWLLGPLMS